MLYMPFIWAPLDEESLASYSDYVELVLAGLGITEVDIEINSRGLPIVSKTRVFLALGKGDWNYFEFVIFLQELLIIPTENNHN